VVSWSKPRDPALAAALVVAAIVRLIGIRFGLPHPLCRPDETSIGSIATSFYQGDLNPHFFNYPPLFMFVVALCVLLWLRTGWVLGYFKNTNEMNALISTTSVHQIARFVSAAAGVGSVWLVFRIGRQLFDRLTSLVAATFLALAFLHVRDSHFGVTDVAATGMALMAFLFVVRFDETRAWGHLVAAGVAAGLAAATKYNTALIAGPALLAIFAGGQPRSMSRLLGQFFVFTSTMALAFLAAAPYSVIEWGQFIAALRLESTHLATGHGRIVGRGWYVHLSTTLRYGLGAPLLLAGIVGMFWLVRRKPRVGALVAVFPVSYYLLLGSGYTVFARYMLPVVPFMCLTAAYAVIQAGRWLSGYLDRPGYTPAIVTAIAAIMLIPTTRSVVAFDRLLSRTDNRLVAAQWIEQHFRNGATLGQFGPEGARVFVAAGDPRRSSLYVNAPVRSDGPRPDAVILPSSPLIAPIDLASLAPVLARDYRVGAEFVAAEDDANSVFDVQDEFYLPLSGFGRIRRPGPNLTIYVLR
jgi:4-amino-4-deoxy-L-arabinose transferase-like glycosyltransferase